MADKLEDLRLPELRQELIKHNLDTKGRKQDLVDRLRTFLLSQTKSDPIQEPPKSSPKLTNLTTIQNTTTNGNKQEDDVDLDVDDDSSQKVKKNEKGSSAFSITTSKFLSEAERKKKRTERFNTDENPDTQPNQPPPPQQDEIMKKRLQKFGTTTKSDQEILQKRAERFASTPLISSNREDVLKKRALKFAVKKKR